jgi:hypothetical protein
MPIDPYFTSGWRKSRGRESERLAAMRRAKWPVGSKYERQVTIEMRGGERPGWWPALSVPKSAVEAELERWRELNPGYEFRIKE